MEEYSDFPDIYKNGKVDYRLVNQYCNNINEPFVDRLDMWDMIYNPGGHQDDLLDLFEQLPFDLREYVRDCDIMQGFKEAKSLLRELHKESKKIVNIKR